jgi:hypothetical protein
MTTNTPEADQEETAELHGLLLVVGIVLVLAVLVAITT